MSISIPSNTLEKFTTFGDFLRFLRRRVGLTQMELAMAVGYSDTQISRLEQNLRLPDIPTIEARFISALGLEDETKAVARLLDLAAHVRREDAPALGLCPYKGLSYFDEADADLFVGREALTSKLVERVLALPLSTGTNKLRFLAIVGASGSGKSSLVRAGLMPALRWNQASAHWPMYVLIPTAHPLESLALTLTHDIISVTPAVTLMDDLTSDPRSLHLFIHRILKPMGASQLLLFIDQFEEVFALCRSEEERASFISNLLKAASEKDGPTVIVITLRADFYAYCAIYPQLRQALAENQEYIGTMNSEELRRAIEEPAQRGRWEFEPGLVDLLLHDVGHEPGALPLLSHALLETWQRRRGRTMTMSGYSSSGGVRGAIAETAEAVFTDQFNQEQQTIARRIFLRLTELSDETATADTRRRATFNELILKPEEAVATQTVLKALADARLIMTSEDAAEVAHEALIREWPTLRGWLEDNREALRLHRHLTEAAQEWLAMNREPDMLYRGARLTQAREWVTTHEDEINTLEREFLRDSIEAREQEALEREEQRQRELAAAKELAETQRQSALRLRLSNRIITTIGTIAVILAILAGMFGLRSNQNAVTAQANLTRSEAQRLAAEAKSLMQSGVADPQLIALLSLRSIKTQYTPQGDAALTGAAALPLPRQIFSGHPEGLLSVAFSPDGRYILTGSRDDTARLWDAQTGEELRQFAGHFPGPRDGGVGAGVRAIFSPDGKYVLTGGFDGIAKLWDVETGKELRVFRGHSDAVWGIAFSPDGKYVLTGSLDQTARLWDAKTGKELRQFRGHTDRVCEVAFSPDGRSIVTGSYDNTARLWDAETGKELRVFRGHTHHVVSVAFSPDGRSIVTGSYDNTARLWDVKTSQELRQFSDSTDWINSVAFSPNGRFLLTGSGDKRAILWDIQTGRELHQFRGHTDAIESVAFSSDGHYILTGSGDKMAWMWDLQQASGEHPSFIGHTNAVYGIDFSPDGQYVVTGSADNTARLWDAQTGEELRQFIGHTDWINSVAFSPDGRYIFTGSLDRTARLWDVQTGQELRTFTGHTDGLSIVAFSPDGQYVLTGAWDGTARRWETQTGKIVTIYQVGDGPYGVAFSPDGQYVLTGDFNSNKLSLWNAQTGKRLRQFTGHTEGVNGVAFSPDGRFVLGTSYDKTARLWDVQTSKELQVFVGHTAFLWSGTFSPDGKFVLTAGGDNTARLWDIQTGQEVRRFMGHTGPVEWVVFSPDGKTFATASDDGTARLWNVDYHDTVRYLCSVLLRDFTDAERTQYDITDSAPTCPRP
jgi:WD40 repeat protein/transcriptional regulator with XRE-family HTH domain